MTDKYRFLSCFDALEELTERLSDPSQSVRSIKSSDLALGPLAELLILRRHWQNQGKILRIDGAGDARHSVIRAALDPTDSPVQFGARMGAFQLRGSGDAIELAAHEFALAAGRHAHEAGMPDHAARLIKGAFAEIIGNIREHAGDGAIGLATYELKRNCMWLAVADTGQGIVRGYLSNMSNKSELDAATALNWAVVNHRSRFPRSGRGTGFSTVMRAMLTLDAALRVRSDDASIEVEDPSSGVNWIIRDQDALAGFVVSLHVCWQGRP